MPTPRRRTKIISKTRAETGKVSPQRTCAACREVKNKREMVRLVRTSTGRVEIDVKGKMEGRGTYLCRDIACWEKALKSQQLQHALKIKITPENLKRLGEAGEKLLEESTIG